MEDQDGLDAAVGEEEAAAQLRQPVLHLLIIPASGRSGNVAVATGSGGAAAGIPRGRCALPLTAEGGALAERPGKLSEPTPP